MKKVLQVSVLGLTVLGLLPAASAFAMYDPNNPTPTVGDGQMMIMSAPVEAVPISATISAPLTQGEKVLQVANGLKGKKYVWGGTTPTKGFDASGFVQYVYGKEKVKLARTSAEQFKQGTKVDKKNLKVGDLVFYDTSTGKNKKISFVGIYAGNNKVIAVTTSKGVTTFDMSEKYWSSKYMGAKRVLK